MSRRPSKRARRDEVPAATSCTSWLECQTLTHIPSPNTVFPTRRDTTSATNDDSGIKVKLASQVTKDIFLDRFRKEIIDRYQFSLNKKKPQSPTKSDDGDEEEKDEMQEKRRNILRERILVGLSVCSKALVSSSANDSLIDLVVLASDMAPTRFAVHIPLLAHQQDIPLVLLPDASREMGTLLGVRCAGVMAFRRSGTTTTTTSQGDLDEAREIHRAVDSYVDFVKGKCT